MHVSGYAGIIALRIYTAGLTMDFPTKVSHIILR